VVALAERLTDNGSLTIFLFHGVVNETHHQVRNYTRKHLPAGEFRAILEALGRRGKPLSMDEVVAVCASGRPFPSGAFAITFDDGFENNVSVARPILDALGIPATVYVTSRFVDENGMSWIDRIEYAIENVACGRLSLPWAAAPVEFDTRESKIAVLDDIRRSVKSDPHIDIEALVSDVFRQLDLDEIQSSDDPLDRKMSWTQVGEWIAPGFHVGGHSHSHAILSFLSAHQLAWELDTSLDLLRTRGGVVTSHYSYPEGLAHCYSDEVIAALKARGIVCSPTAIDGINGPGSDPFQLRRVMVN
jgi:peptidoglycan/xylan/chitin deacetylase (PgdA/CDA1 family)